MAVRKRRERYDNVCVTKTNEEIEKLDSTPPEIYSTVVCGFMCRASIIFFPINQCSLVRFVLICLTSVCVLCSVW